MQNFISPHTDSPIGDSWKDGDMEKLNLDMITRLNIPKDYPIHLNPDQCTFKDIAIHARTVQYLKPVTIDKNLRYLRYMETHPHPVDLRHPNKTNFLQHIRYRLTEEHASPHAIEHEWQAIKMLLRAYNQPIWDLKLPPRPKHGKRQIPLPDIVHQFWKHPYDNDLYTKRLYQYLFFHAYLEGQRNPSELANQKTTDVEFTEDGQGILTITETKKYGNIRQIILPQQLATDPHRKSYQNWLDKWRPQAETNQSKDHMWIQPNGKPFTPNHLRMKLSHYGKQLWPQFQPYCTRHWCATARLIQTKIQTGIYDIYSIKEYMGHETIKTTERYVKDATKLYQLAPYDWIRRVLKHPQTVEENTAEKSINTKKHPLSMKTTGENQYGREEIRISPLLLKKSINTKKTGVSISTYVQPISFFFSFESYSSSYGENENTTASFSYVFNDSPPASPKHIELITDESTYPLFSWNLPPYKKHVDSSTNIHRTVSTNGGVVKADTEGYFFHLSSQPSTTSTSSILYPMRECNSTYLFTYHHIFLHSLSLPLNQHIPVTISTSLHHDAGVTWDDDNKNSTNQSKNDVRIGNTGIHPSNQGGEK